MNMNPMHSLKRSSTGTRDAASKMKRSLVPRGMHTVSTVIADKVLQLETGRIGPLADSVVYAQFGKTSMLVSAVSAKAIAAEDFLPLQVDYRERAFARGMIPATISRKEASSSDQEILGARIIDRTLRPLFPEGYFYETQLTATLLSLDPDADPAMLSVIASSAALHASDIPFYGPAGAVMVGLQSPADRQTADGGAIGGEEWTTVIAPDARVPISMQLLYAGCSGSSGTQEARCLMIEAEGKEAPEAAVLQAMRRGQQALLPIFSLQDDLARRVGKQNRRMPLMLPSEEVQKVAVDMLYAEARDRLSAARNEQKTDRSQLQGELQGKGVKLLQERYPEEDPRKLSIAVEAVVRQAMRAVVTEAAGVHHRVYHAASDAGIAPSTAAPAPAELYRVFDAPSGRVDGRGTTDIRPLTAAVDVIPLVHGSALFARGSTQVLSAATLGPLNLSQMLADGTTGFGSSSDIAASLVSSTAASGDNSGTEGSGGVPGAVEDASQSIDAPERVPGADETKSFFLHYDFPPYCTNEVGKIGAINRRSVGHGALAEKAVAPVLPPHETFPYTVRVLAETTGSDGSSSMATVCSATLALMDAGVPISSPVAGISIGAVTPADSGPVGVPGYRAVEAGQPTASTMRPGDGYVLLTDIFGLEDHAGDMDFKVAGTRAGVTAIQLDVKPAGLPLEVLEQALGRAKTAREKLLDTMIAAVPYGQTRAELKPTAPRVVQLMVPPELRTRLLGPGGTNLRRIEQLSTAQLVLDEDLSTGTGASRLFIYGSDAALIAARTMIDNAVQEHLRVTGQPLTIPLTPAHIKAKFPHLVVGIPVTLTVMKTNEFGAVCGFAQEGPEAGWLHVSEVTRQRSHKIQDYLAEGDDVTVQVCDVDVRGRGKLSIKALLKPGEDVMKHIRRKGKAVTTLPVDTAPEVPPAPSAPGVSAPVPATVQEQGEQSLAAVKQTVSESDTKKQGGTQPLPTTSASTSTPAPAQAKPQHQSKQHQHQHQQGASKARHEQKQQQQQQQPRKGAAPSPAPPGTQGAQEASLKVQEAQVRKQIEQLLQSDGRVPETVLKTGVQPAKQSVAAAVPAEASEASFAPSPAIGRGAATSELARVPGKGLVAAAMGLAFLRTGLTIAVARKKQGGRPLTPTTPAAAPTHAPSGSDNVPSGSSIVKADQSAAGGQENAEAPGKGQGGDRKGSRPPQADQTQQRASSTTSAAKSKNKGSSSKAGSSPAAAAPVQQPVASTAALLQTVQVDSPSSTHLSAVTPEAVPAEAARASTDGVETATPLPTPVPVEQAKTKGKKGPKGAKAKAAKQVETPPAAPATEQEPKMT